MNQVAKRFNKLSESDKAGLIDAHGHWLWFTDYGAYRITLFELESEFVEVWYDYYARRIWRIRMPSYNELDIHLKSITLTY